MWTSKQKSVMPEINLIQEEVRHLGNQRISPSLWIWGLGIFSGLVCARFKVYSKAVVVKAGLHAVLWPLCGSKSPLVHGHPISLTTQSRTETPQAATPEEANCLHCWFWGLPDLQDTVSSSPFHTCKSRSHSLSPGVSGYKPELFFNFCTFQTSLPHLDSLSEFFLSFPVTSQNEFLKGPSWSLNLVSSSHSSFLHSTSTG